MSADLSTAQPVSAVKESTARSVAVAMYCILLISYVLMAADRYLFPVLAPDVRRDFHFSLSDTGLLSTIFTLGLGMGGLPTGFLLARFARKTVLLLGIGIFSTGTALIVFSVGFPDMLLYLAATGIGEAMQPCSGDDELRAGQEGVHRVTLGHQRHLSEHFRVAPAAVASHRHFAP